MGASNFCLPSCLQPCETLLCDPHTESDGPEVGLYVKIFLFPLPSHTQLQHGDYSHQKDTTAL